MHTPLPVGTPTPTTLIHLLLPYASQLKRLCLGIDAPHFIQQLHTVTDAGSDITLLKYRGTTDGAITTVDDLLGALSMCRPDSALYGQCTPTRGMFPIVKMAVHEFQEGVILEIDL